jgi:hypothetical protein
MDGESLPGQRMIFPARLFPTKHGVAFLAACRLLCSTACLMALVLVAQSAVPRSVQARLAIAPGQSSTPLPLTTQPGSAAPISMNEEEETSHHGRRESEAASQESRSANRLAAARDARGAAGYLGSLPETRASWVILSARHGHNGCGASLRC